MKTKAILPPNAEAQQPGRLQDRGVSENHYGDPGQVQRLDRRRVTPTGPAAPCLRRTGSTSSPGSTCAIYNRIGQELRGKFLRARRSTFPACVRVQPRVQRRQLLRHLIVFRIRQHIQVRHRMTSTPPIFRL